MADVNSTNDHLRPSGIPGHAEVANVAYAIFTLHGSRDGDDVRNWLEAERRVKAQHAATVHGRPVRASGSVLAPL